MKIIKENEKEKWINILRETKIMRKDGTKYIYYYKKRHLRKKIKDYITYIFKDLNI